METILQDMVKGDRVSQKRAKLRMNFEAVIRHEAEKNISQFGPDAITNESVRKFEDSVSDVRSAVLHNSSKRSSLLRERTIETSKKYDKLAMGIASIVLEATPIDEQAKREYSTKILTNTTSFVKGLLESQVIPFSLFEKNPSVVVRDFTFVTLSEESDEEETSKIKTKIAKVVTEKAKQVLKAEIKMAEEREAIISDIKKVVGDEPKTSATATAPADDEGNTGTDDAPEASSEPPKMSMESGELNLYRTKKERNGGTIFTRILRESSRALIKEECSLDMDKALGEASISFCILETLNTMNLIKDEEDIFNRLIS